MLPLHPAKTLMRRARSYLHHLTYGLRIVQDCAQEACIFLSSGCRQPNAACKVRLGGQVAEVSEETHHSMRRVAVGVLAEQANYWPYLQVSA